MLFEFWFGLDLLVDILLILCLVEIVEDGDGYDVMGLWVWL